jgi:hypothetical protein
LRKNRQSCRPQPNGVQNSGNEQAAAGAPSSTESSTPQPREQLRTEPINHQRGNPVSNHPHHPAYQQELMIDTLWRPQSGSFLHNNQVGAVSSMLQRHENGTHPHMHSFLRNTTTTISGLLKHCDRDLTQTILLPEDIVEIERVLDILTLVRSSKDAFKIAHALLMHIAATSQYGGHATAHLARAAVTVVQNARVLHDCNRIVTLLSVAMHSGANIRSRDNKYRRLLLSFFGIVLQGSAGATSQQALGLCHTAVQNFGRLDILESLDWRYLVLISNANQVSTASDVQYDVNVAWSAYYTPRSLSVAFRNIDVYLERLIMWCTAALDDANSWEVFNAFSADLWTSTLEPADVWELESKTLFCYLCSCLQNTSHIAPRSECHVLLQEALEGLQQHLNIMLWESLNAISRMLMLSNAQPYFGDNRSNLVHRALCRMQGVRNLRLPLGILTASGWAGSSLSATFLETLAQHYCQPYRFSNLRYERRVDSQVRNFLDHHLPLSFSMNAFMHNPSALMPPLGGAEGSTAALLVDLIKYERSRS